MDGDRFDALTRLLGREATRRGATAVAALLAGIVLAGRKSAEAKRSKRSKRIRKLKRGPCLPPQAKCDGTFRFRTCCPDSQGNPRVCELVPVCPESADGKFCCGKERTECTQDCDCCGDLVCPSGACCVSFGTACTGETQCCGGCESGFCCSNAGGECGTTDDCCGALTCVGASPGVNLGLCEEE